MTKHEGEWRAGNLKIGIVVARFNELITNRLLEGATEAWKRIGGGESALEVAYVPGSFELPIVAKTMAGSGRFDAVICLGAVIKGATDHYDYVCGQTASGIMNASLQTNVPVIFGVLTTDTIEQALERAGTKAGNKGADALLAAVETANLLAKLGG